MSRPEAKMRKRGFAATTVVDFYAYFAFAIIIIIFFIVFKVSGDDIQLEIDSKIEKSENQLVLLNVLRMRTTYLDKQVTISDLIQKWDEEPNIYYDILNKSVTIALGKATSIEDEQLVDYSLLLTKKEGYDYECYSFSFEEEEGVCSAFTLKGFWTLKPTKAYRFTHETNFDWENPAYYIIYVPDINKFFMEHKIGDMDSWKETPIVDIPTREGVIHATIWEKKLLK